MNKEKLCGVVRKDLLEILPQFTRGKTVLDIGCLNIDLENFKTNPIHYFLCEIAKECTGVDIEKEVLKLRNEGYKVICKDILKLNLNKKFDVVFAGEVIEHISNHKKFLEVAYRHLADDGILIITTPNPFFIKIFLKYY